jgi:two-component system response regulator
LTLGSSGRPIDILLVEDNPGDVELTKRTLDDSGFSVNVKVADDGHVALSMLRMEGEFANDSHPDLILLDLAMPNQDGNEVLKELSLDTDLKSIPVMVLTSTQSQRSFVYSMGIPISHYCQKPLDLQKFNGVVDQLINPAPVQESRAKTGGSKKKWWWPFG